MKNALLHHCVCVRCTVSMFCTRKVPFFRTLISMGLYNRILPDQIDKSWNSHLIEPFHWRPAVNTALRSVCLSSGAASFTALLLLLLDVFQWRACWRTSRALAGHRLYETIAAIRGVTLDCRCVQWSIVRHNENEHDWWGVHSRPGRQTAPPPASNCSKACQKCPKLLS